MLPKQRRKVDQEVLALVRDMPCCVCGRWPVDASHIKTRGSGGPDTTWNVVPHCRQHHDEWGRSWTRFIAKYPPMAFKLRRLGWTWDGGRLWHPSLANPA